MPTHPGAHPRSFLGLFLLTAFAASSPAQTLPFRRYSVPEGLANSRVSHVFQDSRGYLWFGTWEGLSRFDGVEFRNYGTAEGLPSFLVNVVAEDSRGRIWVGTQGGGVARLLDRKGLSPSGGREDISPSDGREQPSPPGRREELPSSRGHGVPRSMFESHSVGPSRESNNVVGILFDDRGNLWCGTEAGIFRASPDATGDLPFDHVVGNEAVDSSQFACIDDHGRIWSCTRKGILELDGSGIVARHTPPDPQAGLEEPIAVLARPGGGVLVAYGRDLFEIDRPEGSNAAAIWRRFPVALAPFQEVRCALFASRKTLWLGTTVGLIRWRDGQQSTFTADNGLPDISIRSLCEDRDHDVWMGTWSSGAVKLASEAFVNFVVPEAMPDRNASRILEAHDGSIYVPGKAGVVRVRGDCTDVVPGSQSPDFAAVGARILQDRRGDFWIGAAHGLYRFAGPDLDLRNGRHFSEEDGIAPTEVFGAIHEDPAGRLWVSLVDGSLYEWDPAKSSTPRFERIETQAALATQASREILSDSRGQIWFAPYVGLARLVGGNLRRIEPSEGLPDLQTRCLFEDRHHRLWIGTRFHGVSVTDEPAAEKPCFRNYSTKNGLASDAVWSVVEDDEGRMYFGTSRGIERLDVESSRVRHITTFDGLAGDIVSHLLKDVRGNIWAATSEGISRYDPRAEPPPPGPPPIYLSRIRIAGEDLPISETGERSAPAVTLPASKDNLLIEFVGLSFRGEREVAYQYELEGVDSEWSAPSSQRSVNYAHLAPGSYRFLVRAVHASGAQSTEPASFAFRILRPYWQQEWFLASVAVIGAAIAYALHRSRVRSILALEGIRTQIATDIHDDMGSGLAQIAILTEVAKRETPTTAQRTLDEVARLARSMRDSMSDIVWAVDPRRDGSADLVQRMRQTAFNLLEAEGLRVEFRAPHDEEIEGIGLAPDKRRHLLLVLKEALANVARHAQASHVEIEVRLVPGALRLSIRDDGVGFDPEAEHRGHGVVSLRRRATALSAELEIRSTPGWGTVLELTVPL